MNYENNDDAILDDRRILIAFGSETGNSQDSAEDIGRLAERLHFKTWVCEMNDIELSTLLHFPLVIFVLSTTGQGDIPKNARKFWKSLLRKRLPPDCLGRVNFTTFGLGDSSYSKYNWAARKLHKRLEQLGATEFYPRGEADERHDDSIDGAFLPWSASLRTHLLATYPLPPALTPIPLDVRLPPNFTIELVPTTRRVDAKMADHNSPHSMASSNSDVSIERNREESNTPPISDLDQATAGEQLLDRTAAQFSHVDLADPGALEEELRIARTHYSSYALPARSSEGTARFVKGGIDTLDRPNVLRDDASKYSLDDTSDLGSSLPPPDLLPIPTSFNAVLKTNSRVTPDDHWQDVRKLVLLLHPREDPETEENIEPYYKPGDVLTIFPKNFPEDVQALIDLMGWNDVADQPFEHHSRQGNGIPGLPKFTQPRNCFPLPNTTLRQLLLHNYDITAIPKRIFFDQIAWHTSDPMHKERLREFADPKYTDEFYDYTSRPRRSILEILCDFPSVKIPYQEIPSIFPVIRGREYSIASGGELLREHGSDLLRVELLVALVKYKTVLRKTRQGLCSRYLASLRPNTIINVTIGDNQGPPNDGRHVRAPLLAIGPGTGIAPIRGLIWDRASHPECGENVVFFGGRNRKADFYYHDEWHELGVKVHAAFSRDQGEKIYVQDIIRQQANLVCFLIQRGAIICLCGSSGKMPEAVRQALYDALVMGGLAPNPEMAKRIIEHNVEFWEEVW